MAGDQENTAKNKLIAQQNNTVSKNLSASARLLRFSTSNRRAIFSAAGLRPRLSDRLFSFLYLFGFLFFFAAPISWSALYYGLLATDQFESETRFVVRTSEPISFASADATFGIPEAKIAQDTQIIVNNVTSRAMLDAVTKEFDLIDVFGRENIDYFSRLLGNSTPEEMLEYWQDRVDVGISLPGGIVIIKVRAFSSDEAFEILSEIVETSENLINNLSHRVWKDTLQSAERELEQATAAVEAARVAIKNKQQETGILIVDAEAKVVTDLITERRLELVGLQGQRSVSIKSLSANSPIIRTLDNQIEVIKSQIDALRLNLTGQTNENSAENKDDLATFNEQFASLVFEQTLAVEQLAKAAGTFKELKILSSQQLMYIDSFLAPTKPERAEYPKRLLRFFLVFGLAALFWGIFAGMLTIIRGRLN